MTKEFADTMIEKFQKKFYGYALKKTGNMDEASELASRIVCEAYLTLRRVEGVYNWEGYLYRIASNVYAHYVDEIIRNRSSDITELELSDNYDFIQDLVKEEELTLLKREVAWLDRTHREIVLLHYYHGKKIKEISALLDLPAGTVKWHLSDAKKSMKKGMKKMRKSGNLGIEPIRFAGMGHDGMPGPNGDTSTYLNSMLRQNIAYAAYFDARTIDEIAAELGVSPVYVEDEVLFLEENGFLDQLPGNKYRTNIFITNVPAVAYQQTDKIDAQIAHLFCEQYFNTIQDFAINSMNQDLYVPHDDINYLLWSLIPKAQNKIEGLHNEPQNIANTNYRVKRKDGGDYIAHATVYHPADSDHSATKDASHFILCGFMTRICSQKNAASWSLSSDFDTRLFGWEDNRDEDCGFLHLFLEGKLPKTEATLDKYMRLYDRGLIATENGQDQVNVILIKEQLDKSGIINYYDSSFDRKIPDISSELAAKIKALTQEKIDLLKKYYPKHMHQLVAHYNQFHLNTVMILDELLTTGKLKPLTTQQKKGVMTLVYSDVLPPVLSDRAH